MKLAKSKAMLINVRVIPRAKNNRIAEICKDNFKVHLTAAPEDNKANKALIKFLASYFGVRQSSISIVRGLTSHDKIVEIKK